MDKLAEDYLKRADIRLRVLRSIMLREIMRTWSEKPGRLWNWY